ncbi:cysteine hydrolase family protein [Chryseobacterium wangxinyae]|uniref:cysteine hydrolase family protein n=1 Tax=Chryseobacterium sp. CY350 TaxID=2997336 RepID=UPI00227215B7|nr:cysteine hydrolase family protein [Chryseobacterium sp. CY350]MCY0977253.1 cysteine hydrolase family protein [Chryseobacterium sp. CY350]WBZ95727.1 cysteine hydrolase family protein [Chryseobacterium sp. CY350]
MSKQALIIIDIQNEYFENGNLTLVNPVEASLNAGKVLEHFRAKKLPIAHIQHLSADPEALPIFVEGTPGAEIHENVKPLNGEQIFQKYYPNSFRETGLGEYLKENGVTEVIITGMMTHMCVDATTRAAFDFGYKCTVIGDACASKDLEINGKTVKADDVHHAFLAALEFFYGEIKTTDEFLNAVS